MDNRNPKDERDDVRAEKSKPEPIVLDVHDGVHEAATASTKER